MRCCFCIWYIIHHRYNDTTYRTLQERSSTNMFEFCTELLRSWLESPLILLVVGTMLYLAVLSYLTGEARKVRSRLTQRGANPHSWIGNEHSSNTSHRPILILLLFHLYKLGGTSFKGRSSSMPASRKWAALMVFTTPGSHSVFRLNTSGQGVCFASKRHWAGQ